MGCRIEPRAKPHGSRHSVGYGCRVTNRMMTWRELNKRTTRRLRDPVRNRPRTEPGLATWGGHTPSSRPRPSSSALPSRGPMATKTLRQVREGWRQCRGSRASLGRDMKYGEGGMEEKDVKQDLAFVSSAVCRYRGSSTSMLPIMQSIMQDAQMSIFHCRARVSGSKR